MNGFLGLSEENSLNFFVLLHLCIIAESGSCSRRLGRTGVTRELVSYDVDVYFWYKHRNLCFYAWSLPNIKVLLLIRKINTQRSFSTQDLSGF